MNSEYFSLGLTSVTFRGLDIADIVRLAQEAKLSQIEWGGDVHVKPGDFAAAKRAASLTKSGGLSCSAYGSYYRVGDADVGGFELICRTASALGAPIVRVWLGRKGSADTSAEERASMLAETRAIADVAQKYALTVAFEFHGGTLCDNGRSCAAFLGDVARDNVKTYWQPLAFGDSLQNLRDVAGSVVTVHTFHWNARNERFPLALGREAWQGYIAELRRRAALCNLTLEFVKDDSPAQFSEDAATLRALVAQGGS